MIHFTLDGTDPDETSQQYDAPFVIRQTNTVVKAIAVHPLLANSKVTTSAEFVILASPPELSPKSCVFTEKADISISTATAGAQIHCTLDGTTPTVDSPVCTSPLSITKTGSILKVIVTKPGLSPSDVVGLTSPFIIKAVPPVLTPNGGTFTSIAEAGASVVMSCTEPGCTIRYSLDGSFPTLASHLYTGAVTIACTQTVVKCVSVAQDKAPSDVSTSAPFVIEPFEPTFILDGSSEGSRPSFSGGEEEEFAGTIKIHLRSKTQSARIHYTTNGKTPTIKSPVYISGYPIELSTEGQRSVIKALTEAQCRSLSPVAVSNVLDILRRVSAPKIQPDEGGLYSGHVLISMQSSTNHSQIFYTMDSSAPTRLSTMYKLPFMLSTLGRTTIKAFATRDGMGDSAINSATFMLIEQVKTPVLTPSSGTFFESVKINIACTTTDAKIYFTTNGDDPNAGSTQYIDGIYLGLGPRGKQAEYTVKAIAIKCPDMGNSEVAVAEVAIQPRVACPVITPDISGPWENQVEIQIHSATPGASIRYTLDGSKPTENSALYDPQAPPVMRSTNGQVKAIAFADRMAPCITESVKYKIEVCDPTFQPNGGDFEEFVKVKVLCSKSDAVLHYAIVSSPVDCDPSINSTIYERPLKLARTGVWVKAMAAYPDEEESGVTISAPFIIRASKPKFTPSPLVFVTAAHIQVISSTVDSQVRCTFDGSDPTEETPLCVSPVMVPTSGTVIKAVAFKQGLTASQVADSGPIIVKAAPPVLTPDTGSFTNEVSVTMACLEPGCTIHYVFGVQTTPTSASPVYAEPLTVRTTDTVIRAFAVAAGKAPSDIASTQALEILADAVRFSAKGTLWQKTAGAKKMTSSTQLQEQRRGFEDFVDSTEIFLETTTPNAVIVYTTDGKFPTQVYGVKYTKPINDTQIGSECIRAVAFAEGLRPSPFAVSPVYDIIAKEPRPEILPASGGPFVTSVTVSIGNYVADTGSLRNTAPMIVYMTTDGSTPTSSSEMYTEPLEITKLGTTVVKAYMTKAGQADSDVATGSFKVLERVATPATDIISGIFTNNVTVHLSCSTEGARIRYTTDGTKPSAASPEYVDGIVLRQKDHGSYAQYTVKAIATFAPKMGDSLVFESGSLLVEPQANLPLFKPPPSAGPFLLAVQVTMMTFTRGTNIVYTDDGSDPLTSPTRKTYVEPVLLSGQTHEAGDPYPNKVIIKAVGQHDHMTPSMVMTGEYELKRAACTPVFSPGGGDYIAGVSITVTCVRGFYKNGTDVYYSIVDSADPSRDSGGSILYTEPITFSTPGKYTIAAIAMGDNVIDSPTQVSSEYVVDPESKCAQDEYEPGLAHDVNNR
jgi:hypothetical protein